VNLIEGEFGDREEKLKMFAPAGRQSHAREDAQTLNGLAGAALLLMGVKLRDIRAFAITRIFEAERDPDGIRWM
jgi:hypothetical protein